MKDYKGYCSLNHIKITNIFWKLYNDRRNFKE